VQGPAGPKGAAGVAGGSDWLLVGADGFVMSKSGGTATKSMKRIMTGEYCLQPGNKPVWITTLATSGAGPVVASTSAGSTACNASFGHISLCDSKTGASVDDTFIVTQAPQGWNSRARCRADVPVAPDGPC